MDWDIPLLYAFIPFFFMNLCVHVWDASYHVGPVCPVCLRWNCHGWVLKMNVLACSVALSVLLFASVYICLNWERDDASHAAMVTAAFCVVLCAVTSSEVLLVLNDAGVTNLHLWVVLLPAFVVFVIGMIVWFGAVVSALVSYLRSDEYRATHERSDPVPFV